MGLIDDLLNMVSGSFGGLPTIVVMAIPFVIGLVIGILIKKAVIIGIILAIVAVVAAYLGFISLEGVEQGVNNLATKYGPVALTYVAIFFGIVPLSLGLVVGIIIGFIFL